MSPLYILMFLLVCILIREYEAATPLFLQAITSALGQIPFSAGPLSTGLMGAKLAVGSKLLYYLGFFGRRRSRPKAPAKRASPKPQFNSPAGMQPVPMPYAFGAGGFPQQGGFGQPGFPGGSPYGFDPQFYQMLAAQGIDPAMAMQSMNFNPGGFSPASFQSQGGGAGGFPPASFQSSGGMMNQPPVQNPAGQGDSGGDSEGGGSDNDVESFFTFLRDMDDNTCISRLMCDIGADPSFLGEFSENIHGIISTLDVQPSSGAYQYIAIMQGGKREGGCGRKFPQCGDAAYEVVKNVAPSVGVPTNINSEMVNKL